MNLSQAFAALLNGFPEIVGEGYKWKRIVLTTAIVGTIASPLILINLAHPYQGPLPPEAKVVSLLGKVEFGVVHVGVKQVAVASFRAVNGHKYQLIDPLGFDDVERFEVKNPDVQLKVTGFFLRGGKGFFWPLSAISPDGLVLLDSDSQMRTLRSARDPFGWKLFSVYLLMAPLWWLSFANAKKVMQRNLM